MSSDLARNGGAGNAPLSRDQLAALLRDVTEQRDRLMSQYEAMAFQVDESTREVNDALIDARRNARRAADEQHLAEEEATQISELSAELEKARREKTRLADEFARYRIAVARAPVEDPWGMLWRAIAQIVSDGVSWLRAQFPPDSALLPWFDRTVAIAEKAGCIALKYSLAAFEWAKPRIVASWKWLKNESARRFSKS